MANKMSPKKSFTPSAAVAKKVREGSGFPTKVASSSAGKAKTKTGPKEPRF